MTTFSSLSLLSVAQARQRYFSPRVNPRTNCRGCTSLHYAVLSDDVATVTVLLEAGKDPEDAVLD